MLKKEYQTKSVILYDKAHRGAPYTVNHLNWLNGGDLVECAVSEYEGYGFHKDANTAYNLGSDVGGISVKSARARLTTIRLAKERLEFIKLYMQNEPSQLFCYGIYNGGQSFTFYYMTRQEFIDFAIEFTKMTPSEVTPRFTTTTEAMLKWLNERL